jgi:hypothetical protein
MAYTDIDDPSAYFQTALYTGTGSANNSITNDGNSDLQPDWIWFKSRDAGNSHYVVDSSRGRALGLYPDGVNAEVTSSGSTTDCQSFDSNGFTVGTPEDANSTNSSSSTKVAWQWKANGGTTASNTDGSITSTVQANQDAGFSIVTYTTAGSTATIGHGLGAKPDVILLKKRNGAIGWLVRHVSTGTSYLSLNSNAAAVSNPAATWTTTEPTTSVYSIGTSTDVNIDGGEYVAYCFASKQGYSKFGKYVGNGSADGPFVYTGFKPAFVMIKEATGAGSSWAIFDNKRSDSGFNVIDKELAANESSAEYDRAVANTDFLSNGFKIRNTDGWHNTSGDTYIYMAFAEAPFTTSTGIPATAR